MIKSLFKPSIVYRLPIPPTYINNSFIHLRQSGARFTFALNMSLLLSIHPFPGTRLGLWHITEQEAFFREGMPLSREEKEELKHLKDLRKLEWLASRWLLHQVTNAPQRFPLAKDAFSKPFFLDQPDLYCSLSHSHGVVGALTADRNCGCDIQAIVPKMQAIAGKFMGKAEMEAVKLLTEQERLEWYHLYWTAKESLYKAYGLKALDFREHLFVEQLSWDGHSGSALGRIAKEGLEQHYRLRFGKTDFDREALVWAVCL